MMIKARDGCRRQLLLERLVLVGVVGVLYTAPADTQPQNVPADLPDGPVADGFDISRFSSAGNEWFETFHVEHTEPLADALQGRRVGNETRVLVIETAVGPLAFLQDQMAFQHIAEGRAGGKDWMATF